MFRTATALSSVCLLSLFSQSSFADFDFSPKIIANTPGSGTKVATGGHDDEMGVNVASLRVGTYPFGETAGDPYNTGDPGFNTDGASSFASGSALRVVPRAVGGAFLRYWNGIGSPAFTPTPGGESIQLAGSPTRVLTYTRAAATSTPATDTSLLIGNFASNGALHIHLTSSIFENGVAYDPVTGAPVAIPAGDYLISFMLTNPGTGVADSDPLFIVYNNGLSDALNDRAVAYVNATYVPEPASLGVVGLAGVVLTGRRRRAARA